MIIGARQCTCGDLTSGRRARATELAREKAQKQGAWPLFSREIAEIVNSCMREPILPHGEAVFFRAFFNGRARYNCFHEAIVASRPNRGTHGVSHRPHIGGVSFP